MRVRAIADSEICKKILNKWRARYCILLPIGSVALYLFFALAKKVRVWDSVNFSDTLTAIVTFVSIIISFFGVLLTMLITAKEKSKLIAYFLASADKDLFAASIRNLVMCGLVSVIFAAVLFLKDIMPERIILLLSCCEVFTLIRFTALTYRFTNILLMLFIKEKNIPGRREGARLSEESGREMDERIQRGI